MTQTTTQINPASSHNYGTLTVKRKPPVVSRKRLAIETIRLVAHLRGPKIAKRYAYDHYRKLPKARIDGEIREAVKLTNRIKEGVLNFEG